MNVGEGGEIFVGFFSGLVEEEECSSFISFLFEAGVCGGKRGGERVERGRRRITIEDCLWG